MTSFFVPGPEVEVCVTLVATAEDGGAESVTMGFGLRIGADVATDAALSLLSSIN